jgi:DNA-directed RNA polymerase subunit beta'
LVYGKEGELIRSYNLPVGAHLMVENGEKIKAGKVLVKIPRRSSKSGDITGGLPRITELLDS